MGERRRDQGRDDLNSAQSDPTPQFHEVRDLPIEAVSVNSWNANQMDARAFERLVDEFAKTGQIDPIQVVARDDGTYVILGGEHRYLAAKRLGWRRIQAVILTGAQWQDEDLQKFVTVRLNVLRGKLNPTRMVKLYDEMAAKYGADALADLMAYTDAEAWQNTLAEIGRGVQASLPKAAAQKFQAATAGGKIKSVEDLASVLQQVFSDCGSTLDKSYMIFSYGGKKHSFIVLDDAGKRAVEGVLAQCKQDEIDVNEALAQAFTAWLER